MKSGRRRFLSGCLAGWAAGGFGGAAGSRVWAEEAGKGIAGAHEASAFLEGLRFRLAADGWGGAEVREVEAVLRSAAGVLWKYFPGLKREPFVVVRGREGPIVHYQRNIVGEIVMKLDTEDRLWCPYVYQFSHEFCHILCGFHDGPWKENDWFEETMCETASLFVLRRLADSWGQNPPFENWRNYAPEFRHYAQGIMDSRTQVGEGHLGDFYRKHRRELERTPRDRALNGAMALPLLALMEGAPESWEAVAWLNRRPSPEGEDFAAFLERWRAAVPVRHRDFVGEVMRRFDFAPSRAGAAGPTGPANSGD